ncbi:type VII secretion protein EccE [Klenkia terrae]|uniref:type VII secretion protein EccE n=1 Tax=Klenkia terrae TaxID=1052259 RepID=UPI00361FD2E6
MLVPVAVAVVAVLALSLTRWSGRWGYEWAGLRLRHGLRRRRRTLPAQAPAPRLAEAVLDAVVDGGWLDQLDLDGVPAALWVHDGGLSVAVEVTSTGDRPYLARTVVLPPVTALLPAADEGGTRFTLQVLEQVHPAGVGEGPAALSYRELTGGRVPAVSRCWVAVQVLRGADDEDPALRTDLANAARRVVRRLRKAGLRAVPLAPEDAVTGVLGLLGDQVGPAPAVHERWSSWSAGGHRCVTSALDLPADRVSELPAAVAELRERTLAAGTATMLAVAARRGDDGFVDTQVTLRTVVPDGGTGPEVLAGAVGAGVLRRLDGRQRAGVAATLPWAGSSGERRTRHPAGARPRGAPGHRDHGRRHPVARRRRRAGRRRGRRRPAGRAEPVPVRADRRGVPGRAGSGAAARAAGDGPGRRGQHRVRPPLGVDGAGPAGRRRRPGRGGPARPRPPGTGRRRAAGHARPAPPARAGRRRRGRGDSRRAGRWSAVLTCVDSTHEWGRGALGSADVVVSRPLSRTEARQLARVLNLDETLLRSTGRDDALLLASRAGVVQVQHRVTGVEQWLVGAATGRG